MVILETVEQMEQQIIQWATEPIIYVPWLVNLHAISPTNNKISVMLAYTSRDVFVLPFDHTDAPALPYSCLEKLPMGSEHGTFHKKQLLHVYPKARQLIDLHAALYLQGHTIDFKQLESHELQVYKRRLESYRRSGAAVPLMLVIGYGDALVRHFRATYQSDTPPIGLDFFSHKIIPALCFLEQCGVEIHSQEAKLHFGRTLPVENNKVYSDFNPYTTTGRITNSYLNSLKKSDGTRRAFISRHKKGALVSFDFESFHVRLIADMMNLSLPAESVHEYFGKQYFHTNDLTPEQYEESKRRTFTYLYKDGGQIPEDIPFFHQVREFIQQLWTEFTQMGYISSISGRRILASQIENPSPAKIFNYILQLREMEVMMDVIHKLEPIFEQKKSVVALYTYDAILVDFHWDDGSELLEQIIDVMEQRGRYPVRVYVGSNYHDMKNITKLVKNTVPTAIM